MGPVMRPAAQAGVVIIPVDEIADLDPPFALRLVGRHPRMPVWLHVSRVWDFAAVAGRCGNEPDCVVAYDEGDDTFRCSCTGVEYRANGRPVRGRPRRLQTYDVLYRDEVVLIDLDERL